MVQSKCLMSTGQPLSGTRILWHLIGTQVMTGTLLWTGLGLSTEPIILSLNNTPRKHIPCRNANFFYKIKKYLGFQTLQWSKCHNILTIH